MFNKNNGVSQSSIANPLTVAEYFAGIGLVRMGLQQEGWQVQFANDFSEKKFALYQGFFNDPNPHYVINDIFNLDIAAIPQTMLATCSFPCIDLSLAGNMNGFSGKHSSAFWGFVRVLEQQGENAPPLLLVENVTGWLYSNDGKDFRLTVNALNQLGYACDVFTLDALRFTPQSRPRVFLIGTKWEVNRCAESTLSRPTSLLSAQLRKSIWDNLDLQWNYCDIPHPPPLHQCGLSEIVEELPDSDKRWWSEEQTKRHLDMMDVAHRTRVDSLVQDNMIHYRTFFRRRRKGLQRAEVRNDELAGCLRTAAGGSGKQFLIQAGCGKIKMRAMTPREYARLQGVRDEYPIVTDGVQALTGFGDAVCVPAIRWITQHVLNPLVEKHQNNLLQSHELI